MQLPRKKLMRISPKWSLPQTISTFLWIFYLLWIKSALFLHQCMQSCRTGINHRESEAVSRLRSFPCKQLLRYLFTIPNRMHSKQWTKLITSILIYDERTHINSFTTSVVMNRKLNIYKQKSRKYLYHVQIFTSKWAQGNYALVEWHDNKFNETRPRQPNYWNRYTATESIEIIGWRFSFYQHQHNKSLIFFMKIMRVALQNQIIISLNLIKK